MRYALWYCIVARPFAWAGSCFVSCRGESDPMGLRAEGAKHVAEAIKGHVSAL